MTDRQGETVVESASLDTPVEFGLPKVVAKSLRWLAPDRIGLTPWHLPDTASMPKWQGKTWKLSMKTGAWSGPPANLPPQVRRLL